MKAHAHTLDRPLSITEARPILGEIFEAVFKRSAPVRIQRGNRVVRLVPEKIPEPIEVFPEGAITISKERAEWLNSIPQGPMKPIFR